MSCVIVCHVKNLTIGVTGFHHASVSYVFL